MGGEAFAIVESCLHYVNALDFVPFQYQACVVANFDVL